MPTIYTAGDVMDMAASLMNDTAKTVYTYAAQMPYLNMALDSLQEYWEMNNIPVTNTSSAVISVPIGTTEITRAPATAPNYPAELIDIQGLYQRLGGSSDSFIPVPRQEFISHGYDAVQTNQLLCWTWQEQKIKFPPCNVAQDVKLDYIKQIFPAHVAAAADDISVINAKSYLYYKTASLCSLYVGENESRANELNAEAVLALDRATSINVKGKQSAITRRRPFMSSYKRRGY